MSLGFTDAQVEQIAVAQPDEGEYVAVDRHERRTLLRERQTALIPDFEWLSRPGARFLEDIDRAGSLGHEDQLFAIFGRDQGREQPIQRR